MEIKKPKKYYIKNNPAEMWLRETLSTSTLVNQYHFVMLIVDDRKGFVYNTISNSLYIDYNLVWSPLSNFGLSGREIMSHVKSVFDEYFGLDVGDLIDYRYYSGEVG
jgi:hypothetical protein